MMTFFAIIECTAKYLGWSAHLQKINDDASIVSVEHNGKKFSRAYRHWLLDAGEMLKTAENFFKSAKEAFQ